jgi:tetratricopeptide (TPR) repeat protein
VAAGVGAADAAQDNKQSDAKLSSGEREAADKINKAKGGEAKLQAAAEFVGKYPKSSLRPRVAEAVANEISNTTDNDLKISLIQTYLDFFKEPAEAEHVNGMLFTAMLNANRSADVFKLAPAWLEKHPEDVDTLSRLAVLASNEMIKDNASYAGPGQQYGAKAIELLEADKRPANIEVAQWTTFKTSTLPTLYRATGIMYFKAGDKAGAIERLEKAAALRSPDPGVYLILSDLTYEQYEVLAKKYQGTPEGPGKKEMLKQVEATLDKVIESYAQAVGITAGDAQYQAPHDQLKKDLETYYKFRHGGSTDGLQQLMDKYKKPATQ